jgi:biopolymer transport protein ExbD
MRRPTYRSNRREPLGAAMTPMIDVIFLLLVFFVCTASFQAIEQILPTRLSLPGAIDSPAPPDPDLEDLDEIVVRVLWVDGRPAWEINRRQYGSLAQVRAVLEAARNLKSDLPVILDVEPDVPMEHVIDVYDLCRVVGLQRVRFAASAAG